MRLLPRRLSSAAATGPLLAVAGTLGLATLLLAATGFEPLEALRAMLRGAFGGRDHANLAATLARATPIVGMGLAAAVAFRAGLFNLGGEGQMILGALAAALVSLQVPLAAPWLPLLALLAAALAGAAWATLPAWLQFRCGVPLLISSLLLSYPARLFASYLVNHPLRDVASGMAQTHRIPEPAWLPSLAPGSRLHLGMPLVLVLALLLDFLIRRSPSGYELRMLGLNPACARYGGIEVERIGYRVMASSGGLAGLVGAIQVLALQHRYIDGALTIPLFAWIGVMVALLAGARPIAVLAAGLFFAALQTGALGMERETGVPRELSRVVQALVLLLLAVHGRFRPGERRAEAGE